jgi:hypothetical protein
VHKLGSGLLEAAFWGLMVVAMVLSLLLYVLAFVVDMVLGLSPGKEQFSARGWVEEHLDPFGNSAP